MGSSQTHQQQQPAVPDHPPAGPCRRRGTGARASGARTQPDPNAGFTLVEALVVVVISGVLAAVAIPSFTGTLASHRVSGAANSLLGTLELARSEALKRNAIVALCRTADPDAATPSCSSATASVFTGTDWAPGWLLYAKPVGTTTVSAYADGTDTLLRRIKPENSTGGTERITLRLGGGGMVGFAGDGMRVGNATAVSQWIIDYRDPSTTTVGKMARCVSLNVTGRVRISRTDSAGNCNAS